MKNSKSLRKWLDDMNLSHPLLIAGPCSAETENQVLDIAHQLKDSDTIVYRAGIWKPRTRPGNFEGVGSLALQWMKKVKKETGILTTTEVANANHVDLALKNEIGLATPTFGHAGDGNLHVHIMYNRASKADAKKAKAGIHKLMQKVIDLGGVITGEHGIGLAKAPFMGMQHSQSEIAAMHSVKKALDPLGILNPGKIFEPFEVWDHELVDVQLPWDHR